jgi:hypothetical protein
MEIQRGDHVHINVAPFIGSLRRSKQSVVCEVLEVGDDEIEVRTLPPCRELTMRIGRFWVDRGLEVASA